MRANFEPVPTGGIPIERDASPSSANTSHTSPHPCGRHNAPHATCAYTSGKWGCISYPIGATVFRSGCSPSTPRATLYAARSCRRGSDIIGSTLRGACAPRHDYTAPRLRGSHLAAAPAAETSTPAHFGARCSPLATRVSSSLTYNARAGVLHYEQKRVFLAPFSQ